MRILQEQRRVPAVVLVARAEGLARTSLVPRAARLPLPSMRSYRRQGSHYQVLPGDEGKAYESHGPCRIMNLGIVDLSS